MRRMGLLILGALLAVCFCPPGSSAFARSRTTAADARLARIHTVKVSWGRIGYRDVGSGPPLLMLIGGGLPAPSIDDWPPQLINLLARQHHVFAMDYEGIGQSTGRTGTLTIPRLADDAAAFLTAMHIERADVLGWSMGSYVAQTLAIRHPKQVRRLVLCATALGDGSATQASVTGQQQYPGEWLFPQDSQNQARANAFEQAVHSYPRYYEGPDSVAVKELVANFEWVSGAVSEGHHAKRISAPTLVGGGAQDVLLPPPDSADVAKALPNASLHIYEDAGHGFLVQHESDWTSRVDRFLIRTSH